MIKRIRFPRIFFGWWTVLATGLVSFWGHAYYTQGLSVMFKPIAADLGLSRAVTSVAVSIGRFEGGLEALIAGWITDKFGPKWVILFGCFLIGLGFILMNFVNSLWAFYVVFGGIAATGINVALSVPLNKAISNWFVKKRGIALSVKAVFLGLATIVGLPLVTWLLGMLGWRETYVIGGVVMWVVGLPLIWLFVKRERPEYYGLLPDGATTEAELATDTSRMISRGVEYAAEVQEVEFTLRQAMKTRAYWLLTLALAGSGLVVSPIMIHLIPFLTDMGIAPFRAALMVSAAGAIAIPARLFGGFLADRVKKEHLRFILGGISLIIMAGVISFLLSQTVAMAQVFLITFSMYSSIIMTSNAVMMARYFGRKSLGSIQGSAQTITTPFAVAAPIYAGWVYDTTGSYISLFTSAVALAGFTVVLALFILPPKSPARITNIREIV